MPQLLKQCANQQFFYGTLITACYQWTLTLGLSKAAVTSTKTPSTSVISLIGYDSLNRCKASVYWAELMKSRIAHLLLSLKIILTEQGKFKFFKERDTHTHRETDRQRQTDRGRDRDRQRSRRGVGSLWYTRNSNSIHCS